MTDGGWFLVDLDALAALVRELDSFTRRSGALGASIDQDVRRLHECWTGPAADRQAAAQQRWAAACERMREAVSDLRRAAETASGNYSRAVLANQQMWG